MAVRSQEMRSSTRSRSIGTQPFSVTPSISLHSAAYLVTALLALLAIYAVMGNVITWSQGRIDDLRYGNPRTFQLDAVVGHGDSAENPTHLIAMNLNQQIVVIEIPGGDPNKIRTLTGPYLFGAAESKTPVVMRLADVDGDGRKDLIVSAKNEEIVYLNKGDHFQLITPEERARLEQSH